MYDLREMAEVIAELCCDNEGRIHYEEENGDVMYIEVCGSYSLEEYQENDYFNGTGAWVCTDADVKIDSIIYCDEEGNELDLPFDESDLECEIRRILIK